MIPSPEYNLAAYMLAIAQQMERDILDTYVDGDNPATKVLLSERVLYVDREVSQAAFHQFLDVLRQVQKQAQEQMAQYEFRKRVASEYKVLINPEKNEKDDGKSDEAPVQEGKAEGPEPAGAAAGGTGGKDSESGDGSGSKR